MEKEHVGSKVHKRAMKRWEARLKDAREGGLELESEDPRVIVEGILDRLEAVREVRGDTVTAEVCGSELMAGRGGCGGYDHDHREAGCTERSGSSRGGQEQEEEAEQEGAEERQSPGAARGVWNGPERRRTRIEAEARRQGG
jgi:hypothetical protein